MAVEIYMCGVKITHSMVVFSDGGSNIRLENPPALCDMVSGELPCDLSIKVTTDTPVDLYLWEILQALDCIEKTYSVGFTGIIKKLILPYLPHGRADRVFEYGNGVPLELFLKLVAPHFNSISLVDPHSDFYQTLADSIGKFDVTPQHQCVMSTVGSYIMSGDVIVSPDKGAARKIKRLQGGLDYIGKATFIVQAGKKRDRSTGRITETTLPDNADLVGRVCWIVDDIVDGGGTFIPLANLLKQRGAVEVNLYITHGIFSRGLDTFNGVIDNIYCYQTVGNYVTLQDIKKYNTGE